MFFSCAWCKCGEADSKFEMDEPDFLIEGAKSF